MAGVFDITVTGGFCAAHRLPAHGGACARVHGHNFTVTAMLTAPDPGGIDDTGMVMDFLDLKAVMDSVLGELDHKDLNALPAFQNASPTAEILARHIFRRIKAALAAMPGSPGSPNSPESPGLAGSSGAPRAPVRLARVEVRETKDFAAGYRED